MMKWFTNLNFVKRQIIILSLIFLGFQQFMVGQKVMYLPGKYYYPIDYENPNQMEGFLVDCGEPRKPDFWIVVSDRDNNDLYDRPNGTQAVATLKFKEYGYVIENDGLWVKIGVGRRENQKFTDLRKTGWIKKSNLLMWPNALVDENNSITKKAFLLNKVQELERVVKEPDFKLVRIFDGPSSSKVILEKSIYNVYFIFKRENGRILLGGSNSFNHTNVAENLIGWVDQYRVMKWNQRLALECNFDEAPYLERKSDRKKHIVGFNSQINAIDFTSSGEKSEGVLWDSDPVKLDPTLLAKENNRRPIGEIFRFPIFQMAEKYIESGVLLRIPVIKGNRSSGIFGTGDQIRLEEEIKKMQQKKGNLNIYFLIEGTQKTSRFRGAIVSSIASIDKHLPDGVKVRFGAAVYRDASLEQEGLDFSLKKLSPDKNEVIRFIENERFIDAAGDDEWTNLRSAMSRLLVRGEMPENALNVVVVIGANADFSFSRSRVLTSKSQDLIDGEKLEQLEQKLIDQEVNLLYFQLENNEGRVYSKFTDDARAAIVNVAMKMEDEQSKNLGNTKLTKLTIEDFGDNEEELTVNGVFYGYIKRPYKGKDLSHLQLAEGIGKSLETIVERYNKALSFYFNMTIGGESLDNISDEFAPIIDRILSDLVQKQSISKEDIEKLRFERIKLYSTVYLPRYVPELPKPYKTVVFMPSMELGDYIAQLGQMERAMNGPSDIQREQLYEVMVDLMQKLSGDKLDIREVNSKSIDELRRKMNGLELEGYSLNDNLGFKIEDIKNKKIVSETILQELASRIIKCRRELNKIRDKGSSYDFAYSITDESEKSLYYWISTDLLF
jgi:hypothetical protein